MVFRNSLVRICCPVNGPSYLPSAETKYLARAVIIWVSNVRLVRCAGYYAKASFLVFLERELECELLEIKSCGLR